VPRLPGDVILLLSFFWTIATPADFQLDPSRIFFLCVVQLGYRSCITLTGPVADHVLGRSCPFISGRECLFVSLPRLPGGLSPFSISDPKPYSIPLFLYAFLLGIWIVFVSSKPVPFFLLAFFFLM